MRVPTLSALVLVGIGPSAMAALDVEARTPYQLRVVLRFGDHPDFTAQFRTEFARDLRGSLQSHLGRLGSIEAIDLASIETVKREPAWKAFDSAGFTALDSLNEITGTKTHFVQVERTEGRYEVRARQVDGVTGFVSIVRTASTQSRGFLSRIATLIVGQDFGLVGTLEPGAGGRDRIQVSFKGGALGERMDKWVKKGDVFAIVQVRSITSTRKGDARTKSPAATQTRRFGFRTDSMVLQATDDPKGGLVMCRLFNRYDDPLPERGNVLGYRCVKLGTIQAPLKLRLVDAAGAAHTGGAVQVRFRPDRFPERPGEGEPAEFKNGIFQSGASLSGLALVHVSVAGRDVARIPIAIMDDEVVVQRVRVEPGAELRGRLEQARRDVMGRITDARRTQVRCFQELITLEKDKKLAEALARAEATQQSTLAEEAELADSIQRLADRAKHDLPSSSGFTNDCEQQLALLRDKRAELKNHIDSLKEAIRIQNDPAIQAKRKAVQESVRQAELLVQQAEYDGALARLDEAIADLDDAEAKKAVQSRRDTLAKAWMVRDAEHAAARAFVYQKWPALANDREIAEALPEARRAFEKCKAVGDRLTLNKLMLAEPEVTNRLREQVDRLKGSAEEEDQKTLMRLEAVSTELLSFLSDVRAYLRSGSTDG